MPKDVTFQWDMSQPSKMFIARQISRLFIISNSRNPIPNIVLLISQLPDITQKTTFIENVPMDVAFHLRYVLAF